MASRPRPSLLALFDPLSIASPPPQKRDEQPPLTWPPSPDSGSDKENLNTTTPRCARASKETYADNCSETVFFKRSYSRSKPTEESNVSSGLLGKSFLLDSDLNADATNLCLLQLEDELGNTSNDVYTHNEGYLKGSDALRRPLLEIELFPNNSCAPTPRARDNRLVYLDTPNSTPKSVYKFAAGLAQLDPTTPRPATYPNSRELTRSPASLGSPSPTITLSTRVNAKPRSSLSSVLAEPMLSQLPGPLNPISSSLGSSGTPSSPFLDSPLDLRSASFEIQNSLCMKRVALSGDLINDEISFLARMEDDSFMDYSRAQGSDRADVSSTATDAKSQSLPPAARGHETSSLPLGSPTSVASVSPPLSLSPSEVESDSELDGNDVTPCTPVELQLHTPSSSPVSFKSAIHAQALAPKKSVAALRAESMRIRDSAISDKARARFDAGLGVSQNAKQGAMHPRASHIEVPPLARTQPLAIKKKDGTTAATAYMSNSTAQHSAPSETLQRSASIAPAKARPSLSRRVSLCKDLVSNMPKMTESVSTRGQNRLSVSTSTTSAPAKANGTLGRPGGARRVPLTADAPLFKTKMPSPVEAPHVNSKADGPQRPPVAIPRAVATMPSGEAEGKHPSFGSRSLSRATAPTAVRVPAKLSAGIPRSASMSASSRLPMPQVKSSSRIPGPAARKAF
ncbi:hypothetical protein EW145_g2374 [Phellinidium pouzarii]|uniref:Uncharacterized protein n=1 Tax=Phellinidium pouzarii TaxID=167371 RepID=A0A4S4LBC5_9AGAM|nr:hypothetical protein EW145_g2374 [Phellinidium pouzarii]